MYYPLYYVTARSTMIYNNKNSNDENMTLTINMRKKSPQYLSCISDKVKEETKQRHR